MEGISTRCRGLLLTIIFCTGASFLFGQKAMVITVYDSATTHALSDAIVRVMPLSRTSRTKGNVEVTDRRGQMMVTYVEPSVVHISYLGYNSLFDTIYNSDNKNYYLKKTSSNIDDVVVTGQYTASSARSSVYNTITYTEKDFREKGATNLREALLGSLNIDMSQDPVFGSGVSLNGISGEGVKIMVDGVPVVGRQNGVLDLSQISLSNIERVEVIRGPMSAVYGPDAMGGVINLISKTNQPDKYEINLKGYYESVGQYNASLTGGINLGKSQFFIGGGRNFFGGFSLNDTSRHKDWLPKEQYYANAKYIYSTGKFNIWASFSFLRELMLDRGNLEPNTTYAFDTHLLTYRPIGTIATTIPIKDYSKIDLMLAYSGYFNFVDYYRKDLVSLRETLLNNDPGLPQDTSTYHHITGRATYTLNALNNRLGFQFGTDINQEYTIQNMIANGSQQMGDYAVFSSASLKFVEGLNIQPAVRFAYNTKYNTPLIPSLNIKYDFAKYFSMRVSYGRGYRAPSLSELYLSFHDSNHNLNGNPDLKPENGHSVNADFTYHLTKGKHNLKIIPSGFFNKISDKIDYVLTNSQTTPQVYEEFNINKYMNTGLEVDAEYSWDRFSIRPGFNYIWYWITLDQTLSKLHSGIFAVQTGYKIPKAEIKVVVIYKYSGRAPLYALSGGNSGEYGTRDPFNTLDVSLSRDFWKNRIQLTAGAKNLFNITTINTPGGQVFGHGSDPNSTLALWGRTYFISLNLHFVK